MEMEGRGYSDLLRNTSEEMLLKSLMENPIGISAPSMEMLGFKNISQTLRVDSEELFNSWLSNGEIPGFNLATIPHRTRQVSRRISTEFAVSSSQQNGDAIHKKSGNNLSLQNLSTPDEHMSDVSQRSLRNPTEKGMEAGNLYLAKAWFHSNHSMTRSRSSELRRRYVAMQNSQTAIPGPPHDMSGRGTNQMKQALTNTSNFCDVSTNETPNQLQTFMSPSSSSTSPFNNPAANVDTVSSVVSMLKGTLERKKTGNQFDKESLEGNSFEFYNSQQVAPSMNADQVEANHASEPTRNFHIISSIQVQGSRNLASIDRSAELNFEGHVNPGNQIQMSTFSREPSQSESSAAAPPVSTGFEVCDGPAHSEQALCISESSRKHVGNGSSDQSSKAKELRDRIFENNLKNERKKVSLVRMGSISSGRSAEKGDPTKKRRVERSRKMAEAKERNLIPTLPSDMQSILKRCDNLEKEVRSLKLNLSFMNRKDSEQTKQIEELQKQNEDLMEEKERLLEEIERIISEPGRM